MDTPTVLGIGAFAAGVTQLVKDLGVSGDWLKLTCVVAGAFAAVMSNLEPAAWSQLSYVLIALTTTGLVSFGNDVIQKMNPSAN